jgi:hypothetical protein
MMVRKSLKGGHAMPYRTEAELPETVKNVLPAHAQEIYKVAFNNAGKKKKDQGGSDEKIHYAAMTLIMPLISIGGCWMYGKMKGVESMNGAEDTKTDVRRNRAAESVQ